MYKRFLKRTFDFILSFKALIVLAPVFIILTVILCFINKGKPFFYQQRPGRNEKIFYIIKFKTMTDTTDAGGNLLPNHLRTTKFGTFLRKTSLDEIPQLINVIRGDMSLVGPRPLRVHYLPYYTVEEAIRHNVRPGITGLAQVSGRNALTWGDRLAFDVEYVNNLSFRNDIKIIVLTLKKLLRPEGIDLHDMADLDELRKENPIFKPSITILK